MELTSQAQAYQASGVARAADRHEAALISARIERLPFTRWHARVLGIVGFVHMTDAFDALTKS